MGLKSIRYTLDGLGAGGGGGDMDVGISVDGVELSVVEAAGSDELGLGDSAEVVKSGVDEPGAIAPRPVDVAA